MNTIYIMFVAVQSNRKYLLLQNISGKKMIFVSKKRQIALKMVNRRPPLPGSIPILTAVAKELIWQRWRRRGRHDVCKVWSGSL